MLKCAVLTQTDLFNVLIRRSRGRYIVLVDITLSVEMGLAFFLHRIWLIGLILFAMLAQPDIFNILMKLSKGLFWLIMLSK